MYCSKKWRNKLNSKDAEPEAPQWDFERNVAQTVKLQIKLLLSYVDKTVKNKEEKRYRYLFPLKYLLCYAATSGLQDFRTSGYSKNGDGSRRGICLVVKNADSRT